MQDTREGLIDALDLERKSKAIFCVLGEWEHGNRRSWDLWWWNTEVIYEGCPLYEESEKGILGAVNVGLLLYWPCVDISYDKMWAVIATYNPGKVFSKPMHPWLPNNPGAAGKICTLVRYVIQSPSIHPIVRPWVFPAVLQPKNKQNRTKQQQLGEQLVHHLAPS